MDSGARVPSLFRLEQVGLNLEFADCLNRWPESNQAVTTEIVIHAIEHEVIRLLAISVREELRAGPHVIRPGPAAYGAGRSIADPDDPGAEDRELCEIPAVQRK